MQQAVTELVKLGPLPASDKADVNVLEEYARLLDSISKPVTDEEARTLVTIFGPDDCYGLVWTLIDLVESAPGWPLADLSSFGGNYWVQKLLMHVENKRRQLQNKE
jgi:hypothetical protein